MLNINEGSRPRHELFSGASRLKTSRTRKNDDPNGLEGLKLTLYIPVLAGELHKLEKFEPARALGTFEQETSPTLIVSKRRQSSVTSFFFAAKRLQTSF